MADGSARRISDVRIGDELVGIVNREKVRRAWNYRYERSRVINKIDTVVQPVYRITLENGAVVVCFFAHRWLTERGWKFTSRLTLNNQIRTLSGPATITPSQTDSYRFGYLAGMIRGDGTLKRYDYSGLYKRSNRAAAQTTDVQHHFRIALKDDEGLDRTAAFLLEYGVSTHRVVFSEAVGARMPINAIRNHSRDAFDKINDLIALRNEDPEWKRGWLAGIFDAEGGATTAVRIHNTDAEILAISQAALETFGFRTARDVAQENGCSAVRLLGGLPEAVRFFNLVNPAIGRKFPAFGKHMNGGSRIVEIEKLSESMEMVDLTTSTENFVANGLISHNCYVPLVTKQPRPDFDAGAVPRKDFPIRLERDAERYRAAGVRDQIMLSFTTDPYHPGNTALTRSTLLTLIEHDLSFCTLTKGGTRSLRDIDLFRRDRDAFASTMTSVDETFSKKWERSAATPADRMDALSQFHARGIFTWISLEPTLDIEASLAVIEATHPFVDLYKVGRANYLKEITRTTDWADYTARVVELLNKRNKRHYIKLDLQPYLPVGYMNPLRVPQHH